MVCKKNNMIARENPTPPCVFPSNISSSILSNEVIQDEEEAESSTQSIQIVESLLVVTPSPVSPNFYEIYDITHTHTHRRRH